jgi:hypothetical protein
MNPGFVQLRTAAIADRTQSDRPMFDAKVSRLFGSRSYHVFCFSEAMLFLNAVEPQAASNGAGGGAVVAGALVGGLVGAMVGAAIASSTDSPGVRKDNSNLLSDDQLLDVARQRGRSLVADYPDIVGARIDGPGAMDKLFGSSKLVGYVNLRDRTLGRLTLEINSKQDMMTAIQALKKRLGDRLQVNLEWNEAAKVFVKTK